MDAMLLAVRDGMHDQVDLLLAENMRLLHTRTRDGLTLLMEAASHGRTAILDLLVRNGAPIGDVHNLGGGVTALYYAIRAGHQGVVSHLLDLGASVVIQRAPRFTALMLACQVKQRTIVQAILAHAMCNTEYLNVRDEYGRTALWVACEWGDEEIIQRLLLAGADMAVTDEHGITSIDAARKTSQQTTLRVLEVTVLRCIMGIMGIPGAACEKVAYFTCLLCIHIDDLTCIVSGG
jgi:ankyrin repeat protein